MEYTPQECKHCHKMIENWWQFSDWLPDGPYHNECIPAVIQVETDRREEERLDEQYQLFRMLRNAGNPPADEPEEE